MRSATRVIALVASAALVATSTAAAADAPAAAPQVSVAQAQAPSAWMMLSALSSTRAVALGGANAAAQPANIPPPPPEMAAGLGVNGEIIGFIVMFALIAIALGISGPSGRPNSPP